MKGFFKIFGYWWFHPDYWIYLFSELNWCVHKGYGWYWPMKVVWCRMRQHPYGTVYYTSAYEPDTTCKNCCDET